MALPSFRRALHVRLTQKALENLGPAYGRHFISSFE